MLFSPAPERHCKKQNFKNLYNSSRMGLDLLLPATKAFQQRRASNIFGKIWTHVYLLLGQVF